MKKFVCTYIVLFAIMVFASCLKQDYQTQEKVRAFPPHPLAGTEIQLDSLGWEADEYTENLFIYIHDRPDLFMPFWKLDISLRLDRSSVWMPVNPSSGFVYHLGPGSLFIATAQPDTTLAGTSTSVKINFR